MVSISELPLPPALNMPLDTPIRELCRWRCNIWGTHTHKNSQAGEFLQRGPAAKLDNFAFDPWDPAGNGSEPISQNYSLTSTRVLWHRRCPQNKVNNLDFGKPLVSFFSHPNNVSKYAFVRYNHYSIGQKRMYEYLDTSVQSKSIDVMQAVLPHPSQNMYTAVKLTDLP